MCVACQLLTQICNRTWYTVVAGHDYDRSVRKRGECKANYFHNTILMITAT